MVNSTEDGSPKPKDSSRRTLLKVSIGIIGGGLTAIPLIPALSYLSHPLTHSTTSTGDSLIRIGRRSRFIGQPPVKVQLFTDRSDAWNRIRQIQVGSCWVVEHQGLLTAFSTVCPHLGCAVDFVGEDHKFKCPCHRSTFHEQTGDAESGPSPRGLDALELAYEGEFVAVRYQRFRQGIATKEPI